MESTWPVSNKKFKEHVDDTSQHLSTIDRANISTISSISSGMVSNTAALNAHVKSYHPSLDDIHAEIDNSISNHTEIPHVIEYGSNDNGSYRKWSNGDIEQWGTGSANGEARDLPVAFPNTEYMVLVTPKNYGQGDSFGTKNRTTSTFAICMGWDCEGSHVESNSGVSVFWYARSL